MTVQLWYQTSQSTEKNLPGLPVTKNKVSAEHLRNSSPPKHKESDESCRKKGGGPAVDLDTLLLPSEDSSVVVLAVAPFETATTTRRRGIINRVDANIVIQKMIYISM